MQQRITPRRTQSESPQRNNDMRRCTQSVNPQCINDCRGAMILRGLE